MISSLSETFRISFFQVHQRCISQDIERWGPTWQAGQVPVVFFVTFVVLRAHLWSLEVRALGRLCNASVLPPNREKAGARARITPPVSPGGRAAASRPAGPGQPKSESKSDSVKHTRQRQTRLESVWARQH